MNMDTFKLFDSVATAITSLFGDRCEVVLEEVNNKTQEQVIAAIQNGFVTGRNVGDIANNYGMEIQTGILEDGNCFNTFLQTPTGKLLRSSTVALHDSKGVIIAYLSINFDTTDFVLAEKALLNLVKGPQNISDKQQDNQKDTIHVQALLETLIKESIDFVGKPVATMTKEDKIKGLKYLNKKGAFLIKKSGDRVARFYDISKYTIYSYLESDTVVIS